MDSILATFGNTSSVLEGEIEAASVSTPSDTPSWGSVFLRLNASRRASRGSVLSHDCCTFHCFFFGVIPVGTSSVIPEERKLEVEDRTDLTFLLDSAYV
jgi:hypothetical protein